MELKGHYDKEADILAMWTGEKEATGSTAECGPYLGGLPGNRGRP